MAQDGDEEKAKTQGRAFRENTKPWLEWYVDALKLIVPASILSGAGFVFAYLQTVGAPFPATDLPALTSLFISVSLLFVFIAAYIAVVIFMPAAFCWTPEKLHRRLGPFSHGGRGFFVKLLKKTVVVDLAFYFGLVGLLIGLICVLIYQLSILWLLALVVLGALAGLSLSILLANKVCVQDKSCDAAEGSKWLRSFQIEIATYSIRNAFWGLLTWSPVLLFFLFQFTLAWWNGLNHWDLFIALLGLFLILAAFYALLSFPPFKIQNLLFLLAGLIFLIAVSFPSSMGALTLRALGIGGGIPVSVLLAPAPASLPGKAPEEEVGCLVFSTGSQIILSGIQPSTRANCRGA